MCECVVVEVVGGWGVRRQERGQACMCPARGVARAAVVAAILVAEAVEPAMPAGVETSPCRGITGAENITAAGITATTAMVIEGPITTIIITMTTIPPIITTGLSTAGAADGVLDGVMELLTTPLPVWRWGR